MMTTLYWVGNKKCIYYILYNAIMHSLNLRQVAVHSLPKQDKVKVSWLEHHLRVQGRLLFVTVGTAPNKSPCWVSSELRTAHAPPALVVGSFVRSK